MEARGEGEDGPWRWPGERQRQRPASSLVQRAQQQRYNKRGDAEEEGARLRGVRAEGCALELPVRDFGFVWRGC